MKDKKVGHNKKLSRNHNSNDNGRIETIVIKVITTTKW